MRVPSPSLRGVDRAGGASASTARRARQPSVPVLPSGLPHLLSTLSNDSVDARAIVNAVERVPAIAAHLLTLANSPWAAPPRPVVSLTNACALLGLRLVRSLSIALTVAKPFNASRCPDFDAGRYWCTAFLAADGAARLAPHMGVESEREALRTAGLLHNLGLLWMAEKWPAQTAAALQTAATGQHGSLAALLRAATGTDYCESGGMLGDAWKLPEMLTIAMRHHLDLEYRGPHWQFAAACGAAAAMAAALWRGASVMPEDSVWHSLDIASSAMDAIFDQLAGKFDSTRELAHTLFHN